MEVILRCALPDRPGALAGLAGAIGEAGGDIEAVEVVEAADGRALDDLVIVVAPDRLGALVERVGAVDGVELIHAGPSRGHPGDAVSRLALGVESILNGAMLLDHGMTVLLGGLLRAQSAEFVDSADAPRPGGKVLVLGFDDRVLVLRRDYRFTDTERHRAEAVLRLCLEAAHLTRAPGV